MGGTAQANRVGRWSLEWVAAVLAVLVLPPLCGAEVDFLTAVTVGDRAQVAKWVQAEPQCVTRRNANGYTGLEAAINGGFLDIAGMLLAHGADPSAVDHTGQPLLLSVLHRQDYAAAALLIDRGAALNAPWGADAETPVQVLLCQFTTQTKPPGPDELWVEIYRTNHELRTRPPAVLRHALVRKLLQTMLEKGAGLAADDLVSWTVLVIAIEQHDLALLKVAFQQGARLLPAATMQNTNLYGKYDPVFEAVGSSLDPPAMAFLRGQGVDPTLLLTAAIRLQDRDVAEALLQSGADANFRQSLSFYDPPYPARQAISQPEWLQLLVDHGLELRTPDRSNEYLLFLAASCEDPTSLQILLKAGADIDAIDGNRAHSALGHALDWDNLHAAEALCAAGASWRRGVDFPYAVNLFAQWHRKPERRVAYYHLLLGYPGWLPLALLAIGVVVVGRWRRRQRARLAVAPASAEPAPVVVASGGGSGWHAAGSELTPRQEARLRTLTAAQVDWRRSLGWTAAALGAWLGWVLLDPLLSRIAFGQLLASPPAIYPRPWGAGDAVWLVVVVLTGGLLALCGGFQVIRNRRVVAGLFWLYCVGWALVAVADGMIATGYILWLPDWLMVGFAGLHAGVATSCLVRGWQARRRQREIERLEADRALPSLAAGELQTQLEDQRGWDEAERGNDQR